LEIELKEWIEWKFLENFRIAIIVVGEKGFSGIEKE
jgi:hypothetical protein